MDWFQLFKSNSANKFWFDGITLTAALIAVSQVLYKLWFRVYRKVSGSDVVEDNFLRYYIITSLWMILLLWIALKFTEAHTQRISILIIFALLSFLSIIVVIWRYINVNAYCQDPKSDKKPTDLGRKKSNMWPYFVLLGPSIIIIFIMIIAYTSSIPNQENRIFLLIAYMATLMILAVMRLVWTWVDTQGLLRLSIESPDSFNEKGNR